MTAHGVIPCHLCGGTGWIVYASDDDQAYEMPCPNGCPMPELPDVEEVPY